MINTLDKKINALAARHSWHISPRAGDGLHWYEVAPMDRPDRDAILRTLARCKGLTAETWEPYSSTAWACVIRVYDAAELAEWRRVDAQKTDLANYFCKIIHDGGTQEQAKAAQLLRAHELDAMQAYAKLYARPARPTASAAAGASPAPRTTGRRSWVHPIHRQHQHNRRLHTMTRDNNTLIYEAIGITYTPAEIHAIAATLATPEQITARAAAMAEATGTGTAADYIDTAEQATIADSLHTYNTWKAQGLQVKRGQKATISAMLWRWTDKPPKAQRSDSGDDAPDPHYYMKRCYLFTAAQVERPAPVHVKTPEEIAARNAELAAARKVRKAAQQAAAATAPAAPAIPAPAPTPEPSKPAAVVAVVEHHTLHDDAPAPEPVQLDFATLAAQVLA